MNKKSFSLSSTIISRDKIKKSIMKTKNVITIICILLCSFSISAQTTITKPLQGFRGGDTLFKQQIEYKDPGRRGENVLWDFSRLKSINDDYRVCYYVPKKKMLDKQLITCLENRTMYKYAICSDSVLLLGFENSGSKMYNTNPELQLFFPFTYGDSIAKKFEGFGEFMSTHSSSTVGRLITVADATGTLILPDGDTIFNALRIRSDRFYMQQMLPIGFEQEKQFSQNDTITIEDVTDENIDNSDIAKSKAIESIRKNLVGKLAPSIGNNETESSNQDSTNNIMKQRSITRGRWLKERTDSIYFRTETCRWYAPGYRYPLFETICNKSRHLKNDTLEANDVATAFYFPPSKHSYLKVDPENQKILDSLQIVRESAIPSQTDTLLFDYNYYPNPIRSDLNVELLLDLPSTVLFRIFDSSGNLMLSQQEGSHAAGQHYFTLQTSRIRPGEYLLHIVVNYQTAYAVLMKF